MRKYGMLFSFITLTVMLMGLFSANAAELEIAQPAPDFSLKDQDGQVHQLADYRGRWVVLYFYPKDDTPGCTTEACQFRDDVLALRQLKVQILGVSLDDSQSHARFAKKYELPFPLLADVDAQVAQQYGALGGFGPLRYAKRHTFIIDPQGAIARIYRKVSPKAHSQQVISDITALTAAR